MRAPASPRSVSPPRQVPTPQPRTGEGRSTTKWPPPPDTQEAALCAAAPRRPAPSATGSSFPGPAAAPRSALGIVGADGDSAAGRRAGPTRLLGAVVLRPRKAPQTRGQPGWGETTTPGMPRGRRQRARPPARRRAGPGRRGLAASSPGRFAYRRRRARLRLRLQAQARSQAQAQPWGAALRLAGESPC